MLSLWKFEKLMLVWERPPAGSASQAAERNSLDLTFRISKQPLVEPAGLLIMDPQVFVKAFESAGSVPIFWNLGFRPDRIGETGEENPPAPLGRVLRGWDAKVPTCLRSDFRSTTATTLSSPRTPPEWKVAVLSTDPCCSETRTETRGETAAGTQQVEGEHKLISTWSPSDGAAAGEMQRGGISLICNI